MSLGTHAESFLPILVPLRFVGVLIPPLLVFTLEWHWVYSVFIAYILSGLGLGIFEVTFLSVITPLGKAGGYYSSELLIQPHRIPFANLPVIAIYNWRSLQATKSWAIIGCPAGFGTINILGLTLSILDAKWCVGRTCVWKRQVKAQSTYTVYIYVCV